MDTQPFLTWLADLIRTAGRPEVADVEALPTWCVRVRFGDGAACFAKVAHVGKASTGTPGRPDWPGPREGLDRPNPAPAAEHTSMRPGYFAGWLRHLIEHAQPSPVAEVADFAEVGAQGPGWPESGLKVSFTDGTCVYLAIVRTSADSGDDPDLPTVFTEVDDGEVPGLRSDRVGGEGADHPVASAGR